MFARQSHHINQIMIVDQRAATFHQLVGQDRGYGVFTCAGKGVDPDERGRLVVVGHVALMRRRIGFAAIESSTGAPS